MTTPAEEVLASNNWPLVAAVFGYSNPKAPLTLDGEFDRLVALFNGADCPNMAKFIEVVRFSEKEHGVTMSYNLSLIPRDVDAGKEPTVETMTRLFSQPDILVGTRSGVEGAAVWFKNFSEAMQGIEPAKVQSIDKIFGEALKGFSNPPVTTTLAGLAEFVFGGEELQPDDKLKH